MLVIGEGCIPIEDDYTQSLIGLKFGKRLRTMSCSDKVLKWNTLGVQGALLSQLLDPLYISSITIGKELHGLLIYSANSLYIHVVLEMVFYSSILFNALYFTNSM